MGTSPRGVLRPPSFIVFLQTGTHDLEVAPLPRRNLRDISLPNFNLGNMSLTIVLSVVRLFLSDREIRMTKQTTNLALLALGASLIASPVFAANPSAVGTSTVNSTTAAAPSQRNPVLADNGDIRVGKLIGTDVYNDHDQKLGSVDDVLMSPAGQPDVILKVNGDLHQVPWSKLQFGNAHNNSDNKVIMPGTTQNALSTEPQFHYQANNNG
jgi:PRC-barrel domain